MPYITSVERIGIKKGIEQGIQEGIRQGIQQGARQGLLEGIELGLELKFGSEGLKLLLFERLSGVRCSFSSLLLPPCLRKARMVPYRASREADSRSEGWGQSPNQGEDLRKRERDIEEVLRKYASRGPELAEVCGLWGC